ncbi:unnamed protein product [Caenorhabditis auriculariae]|uniref:BLOC-1-related complex subunit 5 n=1 Tax=Caenorhabditis auriculariae TaxID=2777116 RepID=A0A8S1HK96_9PELO|nr:unnamed protein product [Caenorhabditis auriculariae]
MGNEQSSSNNQSNSPSFSFLARTNTKRSKGIVVVKDGNVAQETVEDDETFKRFSEIPRFLPIIPNIINRKTQPPLPVQTYTKMNPTPFFKFSQRFQEHLNICAKSVSAEESKIAPAIKHVDSKIAKVLDVMTKRKTSHDKLQKALFSFKSIQDDVLRIQLLLEDIVPIAETLNELLVPEQRLPPLKLGRVLVRTPAPSSASSQQSTPRRHLRPIDPIEEIHVTDLVDQ